MYGSGRAREETKEEELGADEAGGIGGRQEHRWQDAGQSHSPLGKRGGSSSFAIMDSYSRIASGENANMEIQLLFGSCQGNWTREATLQDSCP